MVGKLRVYFGVFLAVSLASSFAVPNQDSINNNLDDLNQQINLLNKDLNSKQKKKKALESAIKNSEHAISNAELLLRKLRGQRDADLGQLKQLQIKIPELESATLKAQNDVDYSLGKIYRQIRQIDLTESSVLNTNSSLDSNRKKNYLTAILKSEQDYYTDLDAKLHKLQQLNIKLQQEVDRLDDQLGDAKDKHQQLLSVKTVNARQASDVARQIEKEKAQLSNLKQRQIQLNRLLRQLAETERRQKQQALAAKKAAAMASKNNNNKPVTATQAPAQSAPDTSFEDSSPFLQRKLVKPVEGKVLVGFGQRRDTVKNNGILLATKDNTPIYSISNGSVLFSGELPGFGQIIVIDNGDNYTSVYSGVLAKVGKGSRVSAGQVIAGSGSNSNQPMGGVYFELRHLGTPVNPSKLF